MVEIISIIKDILISLATLTTIILGIIGFNQWFQEFKGKTEFTSARNLLSSVYRIRNAISSCRSAFIPANEFPNIYNAFNKSNQAIEGKAYTNIFNNRWKVISKEFDDYNIYCIDTETL